MPYWETLANKYLRDLSISFEDDSEQFSVYVNEHLFEFPKHDSNWLVSPNDWFARTHNATTMHEPGLMAWLLALSEFASGKSVRFYDVGALFGYFSVISAQVFEQIEVKCVEANPISADYIQKVVSWRRLNDTVTVQRLLVSNTSRSNFFLVDGFSFRSFPSALTRLATAYLKNAVKLFLNLNRPEPLRMQSTLVAKLKSVPLQSLLEDFETNKIYILKLDTEGYQAVYLPPATQKLIDYRAIILLELDEPELMTSLDSNNQALVQPFIEAGYSMYWSDHRDANSLIREVKHIGTAENRNSLAVLIPPEYRNQD